MNPRVAASVYLDAKELVLTSGYSGEVEWQSGQMVAEMTNTTILREAAWVILSSGMSARVIERVFPDISKAYHQWDLAALIDADIAAAEEEALQAFSHPGKIRAITAFCLNLHQVGRESLLHALRDEGPQYLMTFDFLGKATSRHLAKNLGEQVAKPDRHLLRITKELGWPDPQAMCGGISQVTGDSVAVVDVVLWRFAVLTPSYIGFIRNSLARWSFGPTA